MKTLSLEGIVTALGVAGILGFLAAHCALAWRAVSVTGYAAALGASLGIYVIAVAIGYSGALRKISARRALRARGGAPAARVLARSPRLL